MIPITIHSETIKLGQMLKLATAVESGSHAKIVIQGGEVKVNGETETRRGRQLRHGDLVRFAGMEYTVQQAS
ncbi:MAG: RNA-binding S4 domain-containing protein [Proteobacteria bacterium]|nr:RNA-binding S4 domain-containing protein [Pseudomonadota bacterium]MBU1710143.1 RNA-binding S4 domain-containing protein [Pseudomonadota bacterium]